MNRITKLFLGVSTGVMSLSAAVSAADNTTVVSPIIENSFSVPFWFVAALIVVTIAILVIALTRPTQEALPMNILAFFLSIYVTAASFVSGDYLTPQTLVSGVTTIQDNLTLYNQTSEVIVPIVIHESIGTLFLCIGILTLSLILLLARVFIYFGESATELDDSIEVPKYDRSLNNR
ncbi:MAG TPA: hypothetical protein O0Y13_05275 [Methanocorpusculum sp.]|nr:hypothetical protein [Methanocorpusculum sp.]HJK62631.1 hypothetical protein [Methanocorpusculum sp.]HJK63452.1 hypothetical protein [Methanocorpusculum sp.]HJK68461.1 hypothetical protein [Methanocorpusculum sp.]